MEPLAVLLPVLRRLLEVFLALGARPLEQAQRLLPLPAPDTTEHMEELGDLCKDVFAGLLLEETGKQGGRRGATTSTH